MSKFSSTKILQLGSTAFRQPYAASHCKFIHGYRLQAKFWFSCNELDDNNWVVDFGALKELKTILEKQFDHTTVVWAKDPHIHIFQDLHVNGIIDLRIMEDGVGIEKFAQFCHQKANDFVDKLTFGRCWCERVEVWEHEGNSACYGFNPTEHFIPTKIITEQPAPEPPQIKTPVDTTPITPPVNNHQPTQREVPLYNTKTKNTYKRLFDGTSWGTKK